MPSESRTFDRETLLDLLVNVIPLAMMLAFIGIFLLVNPFGEDLAATVMQLTILIVTFGALLILTYISGKAISESEAELEEMEGLEAVSESVGAETVIDPEPSTESQAEAPDGDDNY
jgi:uncharacterized membrane protein (DUF4010 family)